MQTNVLPVYDMSVNETGCCPRFNPEGWDGRELHFRDKRFVHATTHGIAHVPLDMGRVFGRVLGHIEAAGAMDSKDYIVLSRDTSAFKADHYFAVSKDVPGEEMTTISGDYVTRVFEGPYSQVPNWKREMQDALLADGRSAKDMYFFYTTCPKCAKAYGKNYVVGVAQV